MSRQSRSGATRSYAPNMAPPPRPRRNFRAPLAILLTLILPPVGMAYMWRRGLFRPQGRILFSAVGTVIMTLWCLRMLPDRELRYDVPVPVSPAQVTVAPDDGTATALSNLDQLLAERQAERDKAAGITPEPTSTTDPAFLAEQEQILHMTVYCYAGSGARYYHSKPVCNTQSNFRELTIEEAMLEGMGACPECNPPVYIGP